MRWFFVWAIVLLPCCDAAGPEPIRYVYQIPPETSDGWRTASLGDVDLDPAPLSALVDRIRDGSYTNIHSVLLVRGGRLVFEAYFPGPTTAERRFVDWNRDELHALHSVTKSVTATLIGIAVDRGLLPGLDEPISSYFPEHADAFADPAKARLTVRHLLTMTAGLEWDEHSYPYSDSRNSHVRMNQSGDPVSFTLHLPSVAEPGEVFRYNSGLSIVLGEILHRVSGLRADAFAEQVLFGPLGITASDWWTYPDGTVQTGGGLSLRPRDMARLGLLYLNEGIWENERVVSEAWVTASTRSQTAETGSGELYGYHWWIIRLPRHDNAFDLSDQILESPAAVGRGGQWIFVYPELDLVAVFTGGNDNALSNQPLDILRRFIFPAVR